MKNMSLEKIAQACGGVYHGSEEMKQSIVESITTDSRQAAKGCLFVAIPGERVDGHDFIPSVFEKGALAVLSEKELENPARTVHSGCIFSGGSQRDRRVLPAAVSISK